MTILEKIKKIKLIAVVRADTPEKASQAVDALILGGITGIELTFTVPEVETVIAEKVAQYKEREDVLIGAGTVLTVDEAEKAIAAGATFIVSPCFDAQVSEYVNGQNVVYTPGCMTVTELKTAYDAGNHLLKLFPGSAFGPSFIQSVKAPLPFINIMPTGGVSLDNIEAWLAAGAFAIGVGGNLLASLATEDYNKITELAREYSQKVVKGENND
ncbi:bifunctional 2-keto-4-hydroxyglutarate aldolase/2-keto-3-deoxy-6-phosphogluconate aldolase [Pseudolactococcus reticulitermitis]|uniref:Uncharacterized protein n=1 Tax=Pseudolactococcus reticulitermitis TaxID=2025039 RepID=A0A224WZI8_9LACT|nr:bifunctional 2-keto-4-hydroxyglutarate aldolase/2-keto-3-deoxy-6-phosphogluconate aldolase [Lactococcus reticulitermitis]GAX47478.1 hypothetical protein RsY01_1078 [Lactococcus reticulitermitis]